LERILAEELAADRSLRAFRAKYEAYRQASRLSRDRDPITSKYPNPAEAAIVAFYGGPDKVERGLELEKQWVATRTRAINRTVAVPKLVFAGVETTVGATVAVVSPEPLKAYPKTLPRPQ
jgi:hypothetical protein